MLAIAQDRRGHLLVGTKEGLCRLRSEVSNSFDLIFPKRISSLRADPQGRLWVTKGGPLSVLAPDGMEVLTNLTGAINQQAGRWLGDALWDSRGDLWLTTTCCGRAGQAFGERAGSGAAFSVEVHG